MKTSALPKNTFILWIALLVCACNKPKEEILHNLNGLPNHLEQIVNCFVEQYNIQGSNICIYEGYFDEDTPRFFSELDIDKHINLIIRDEVDDIPIISDHRVLYSANFKNHTLFYSLDKDKTMAISNNLVWKKTEGAKNTNEFPIIVDWLEAHLVYNKEENVIEISDFKSEYCKGRIEWERDIEILED